jgi:hypothetical protein
MACKLVRFNLGRFLLVGIVNDRLITGLWVWLAWGLVGSLACTGMHWLGCEYYLSKLSVRVCVVLNFDPEGRLRVDLFFACWLVLAGWQVPSHTLVTCPVHINFECILNGGNEFLEETLRSIVRFWSKYQKPKNRHHGSHRICGLGGFSFRNVGMCNVWDALT